MVSNDVILGSIYDLTVPNTTMCSLSPRWPLDFLLWFVHEYLVERSSPLVWALVKNTIMCQILWVLAGMAGSHDVTTGLLRDSEKVGYDTHYKKFSLPYAIAHRRNKNDIEINNETVSSVPLSRRPFGEKLRDFRKILITVTCKKEFRFENSRGQCS